MPAVERELVEQRTALDVGERARRRPIDVEDVEQLKHRPRAVRARAGESATEPREVRPAIVAQADELAVERHSILSKDVGDLRQLGEVISALAAVACAQFD